MDWLILVFIGLGMALMWLFNRFWKAHKQHLIDSKNGSNGVAIREQMKAEREKENMRRGAEAARALALGLQLKAEGKPVMDILGEVAKNHPEGVWFVVEKVLGGELDISKIGQLSGALK